MAAWSIAELVPVRLLPFRLLLFAYFRPKSGVLPTHKKKIIFGHQSDVKLHLEAYVDLSLKMYLAHVIVTSYALSVPRAVVVECIYQCRSTTELFIIQLEHPLPKEPWKPLAEVGNLKKKTLNPPLMYKEYLHTLMSKYCSTVVLLLHCIFNRYSKRYIEPFFYE